MKSNFDDIIEFHEKFGIIRPEAECTLPKDVIEYRCCFMIEELSEYVDAIKDNRLDNVIDSLIDFSYVVLGTAYLHGCRNWDSEDKSKYFKNVYNLEDQMPMMLSDNISLDCIGRLTALVKSYAELMKNPDSPAAIESALVCLHVMHSLSRNLSLLHGFNWTPHWDEVHKCNMSKERSSGADDERSKRKHSLDIVKPKGWVGPNHEVIIQLKIATKQETH